MGTIARQYSLPSIDVWNCILAAPREAHERAYAGSEAFTDIARERLKAAGPAAAETVLKIMRDKSAKPGTRLKAGEMVLASQGIRTEGGATSVSVKGNVTFPISKADVLVMIKGAKENGLVSDAELVGDEEA